MSYRLLMAVLAGSCTTLLAQHQTIKLWPNGAPGVPANPPAEADTTTAKDNLIAGKPLIRLGNVSSPTLTVYEARNNTSGAKVPRSAIGSIQPASPAC